MKKAVNTEDINYILEAEFRQCLKKTRKQEGYTQEKLAKKCNIIRETIARIESGIVSPQLNTLIKILEPIGYTIDIKKIITDENEEILEEKEKDTTN